MIIVVDKKEQVANIENYLNTFHIHFYTSHDSCPINLNTVYHLKSITATITANKKMEELDISSE